jgi:hypothetical protein
MMPLFKLSIYFCYSVSSLSNTNKEKCATFFNFYVYQCYSNCSLFVFFLLSFCPSRTFFGMRMKNMNILSKNVMRYGHILRQDLMPDGELKFLNFLFYRLIFLLMRLNFYLSVSVIKELFQFFFSFTFKITQLLIKIHSCIFL